MRGYTRADRCLSINFTIAYNLYAKLVKLRRELVGLYLALSNCNGEQMTNFNFILCVDGQELEYGWDYDSILTLLLEYARVMDGLYQIYDADLNCLQTIDATDKVQLIAIGDE